VRVGDTRDHGQPGQPDRDEQRGHGRAVRQDRKAKTSSTSTSAAHTSQRILARAATVAAG
jgi:hypothetical protein